MRVIKGIFRYIWALPVLLSLLFALFLVMTAPWHQGTWDFLVTPLISFGLPLMLWSILFFTMSTRKVNGVNIELSALFVVIPAVFATFLVLQWPPQGHPESWEDNYQHLAVVEASIRYICWPVWLFVIGLLVVSIGRNSE